MRTRRAQGPAVGMIGTVVQRTPVFPMGPAQATPGDDPNTSHQTLQLGAQVQYLGDGGVFNGNRWSNVRVLNGSTVLSGSDGVPAGIAQPFNGWFLDKAVQWGTTAGNGLLLQRTPCFPMGPAQATPGDPPNTSGETLQPGATLQYLGDGGQYGGQRWVHVRVLNGTTVVSGSGGHPATIDSPFDCWFTSDVVRWAPGSGPSGSAAQASVAPTSAGVTSQTQAVLKAIANGASVKTFADGSIRVVGSMPGQTATITWAIRADGSAAMTTPAGVTPLGAGTYQIGAILAAVPATPTKIVVAAPTPAPTTAPGTLRPAVGYYLSGAPQHAFLRSNKKDLGLYLASANGPQTVKSTNGGRMWALFNLADDGTLSFVGNFGTVPGAPPPPNANAQQVVAASSYAAVPAPSPIAPPPPPAPPPAPIYDYTSLGYPAFVPAPAPDYEVSGVPGYDPAMAALYTGASLGEQAGEQLAASEMLPPDPFGGMPVDGYDPTGGMPGGDGY